MGKENGLELHGRPFTRAFASALRSSGQIKPSEVPARQNQQRVLRANAKRAALEEKKAIVPKKRAVLRDVTNISCESSYQSCIYAAKVQEKNINQIKKGRAGKSKVAPSVASEVSDLQSRTEAMAAEQKATAESELSEVSNAARNPCFSSGTSLLINDGAAEPDSGLSKVGESDVAGSLTELDNPKFLDIDSNNKDPLLCSLYAPEIFHNLRAAELKRRPYPDFMERIQKDITQAMRGVLVDWLVEVSEEYTLVPDTLYLTVYLIDRFLHGNYIERQRLQLLGITCMLIASKYEEICAPRIEEFCFITDNTYKRDQVLEMENEVLKHFGFQIYIPTSKTFLRRFLRAAQASHVSSSLEMEFLANYLTELTLIEYDFLKFLPSLIAASAVFLAKWTLDQSCHPWNPTLEHYTMYKATDLKASVLALQELQMNTKACPLNAIRFKYKQEKFKSVAALSSPKLLDSLF
ncbi:PREDICTED: cyclin-A2-4-like [Tarenaya hassleriana]|uniref:cyclin-A2-4-like n=1 Tax=Tarenaya hassleriana TaxID=28532 RepID=UPI00053C712C|nr:PREDICTED: cyclin-A2-4-like [Tarenaya hassleriana]XP_010539516.1 PREDICTED: cyclin-A2-4-like [Tarenaya hassleriana]